MTPLSEDPRSAPRSGTAAVPSGDVVVMQVIRTRLLRRGDGVGGSPIRIIEQYWTLDGHLITEIDHWKDENPDA